MIVVVGATGITAWVVLQSRARSRTLLCLNDGFTHEVPILQPKQPRAFLVALLAHSESINGRTLSVGSIPDLT